jgi:hypothetical protein
MRSFGAAAQRVNRSLELVVIVFIRVNIGDKQVKIIMCLENIWRGSSTGAFITK